jgi:glucose-6-phosphate 1-dehydrogenase
MLVTHLFQVAAEVALEPPASMSPADLQDAREAVIAAFRPLTANDVVRGQYQGYRDVDGCGRRLADRHLRRCRMWVDTDRWHGVPFVMSTGKRMARSAQQVTLVMRGVQGPLDASAAPLSTGGPRSSD